MKKSLPRNLLLTTAVFYAGAAVFLSVYSFFSFMPKEIDVFYRPHWVINNTLRLFFDNFIAIQSTAVLFSFSYLGAGNTGGKARSKFFNQTVSLTVIILMVITAFFVVGKEMLSPGINRRLDSLSYLTQISRSYIDRGREALEEGKYEEAARLLEGYLAIKPDEQEGTELYRKATERLGINQENPVPAEQEPMIHMNMTYEDAVRLSSEYLRKQDYYSAYYYATIAAGLDRNDAEAKRLSSEAWLKIEKAEPDSEEEENYRIYNRKKRGTRLLVEGKPVEAYFVFKELLAENPGDTDARGYVAESLRKASELTYFIDEAEASMRLEGTGSIFFINSSGNGYTELVYIGKMVESPDGVFFNDFEAVRISDGGGKAFQLYAPYAKMRGEYALLLGIDKENRSQRIIPEFSAVTVLPEPQNVFRLNADRQILASLSANGHGRLNLTDLMTMEKVSTDYGWKAEPLRVQILLRLLEPFNLLLLSFSMVFLGWIYRRRNGAAGVTGIVFLPVVIFIMKILTSAYQEGMKLAATFLVLKTGFIAAAFIMFAVQAVLLFVIFFAIAGMKNSGET